jgi:hypothetical protein
MHLVVDLLLQNQVQGIALLIVNLGKDLLSEVQKPQVSVGPGLDCHCAVVAGHHHTPGESGGTRVPPHTLAQGDECLLVLKCLFFDLGAGCV